MIGAPAWGRGWLIAAGLSVALHGAAVAALIWQPAGSQAPPRAPLGELRLDIIGPITGQDSAPVQILTSSADPAADLAADQGADAPLAAADLLLPLAVTDTALTDPAMPIDQAAPSGDTPLPAMDPDAPPPDPRIAELLDRIRARLTEPCLLALPALLDQDQVRLNVLAANDRRISQLMRDLTRNLDAEITEQPILLDSRQCPALDFVRRDPGYPLPGVSLHLDSQDIASGDMLGGRLSGSPGYHTTFLLIDDNGVVHDLRRYLVASVAGSRFDIPIARDGQSRDTHQILMAIATAHRIPTVTGHSGELAEDFFAAIAPDLDAQPRIGIAAIYVR